MSQCCICGTKVTTLEAELSRYVCNDCMEQERKRIAIEETPDCVWDGDESGR